MSDTRFFRSDNSDEGKFRSKSGSDNRNVKNLMSGFKIRTKIFYPYPVFFRSDKFGYSNRINFRQHYLNHSLPISSTLTLARSFKDVATT